VAGAMIAFDCLLALSGRVSVMVAPVLDLLTFLRSSEKTAKYRRKIGSAM